MNHPCMKQFLFLLFGFYTISLFGQNYDAVPFDAYQFVNNLVGEGIEFSNVDSLVLSEGSSGGYGFFDVSSPIPGGVIVLAVTGVFVY